MPRPPPKKALFFCTTLHIERATTEIDVEISIQLAATLRITQNTNCSTNILKFNQDMVTAHAVQERSFRIKCRTGFAGDHLLKIFNFLHQATFMSFESSNHFLVICPKEEGKAKSTGIIVKTGQMFQDFFPKHIPTLLGNVENHTFRTVAITFGAALDAFVLFEGGETVVNGGSAQVSPTVQFTFAHFGNDVITAAFVLQYKT